MIGLISNIVDLPVTYSENFSKAQVSAKASFSIWGVQSNLKNNKVLGNHAAAFASRALTDTEICYESMG